MVEVVVRPDYGRYIAASDVQVGCVRIEDFRDIFVCTDCGGRPYETDGAGRIILPIAADAEIEEHVLVAMSYEEAVYRGVARFNTFDLGAPKDIRVDAESRCAAFRKSIFLKSGTPRGV